MPAICSSSSSSSSRISCVDKHTVRQAYETGTVKGARRLNKLLQQLHRGYRLARRARQQAGRQAKQPSSQAKLASSP